MNKINYLLIPCILSSAGGCTPGKQADSLPNIVFIVADDLGYGDLGCYGNTSVSTPHLDRMAQEGMRFTDFYANAPMCSPTRAALLTGRYQQRVGVIRVGDQLNAGEITLGARLRDAGYATGYFGKWHISGHYHDDLMRKERMPMDLGFDLFYGFMGGFIDFQNYLNDRGQLDWWHNRELVTDDKGYATHILTRHATDFINQQHEAQRPFFTVLALPDIHFPWMTQDDPPHYKPGIMHRNFDEEYDRLGPHTGTDRLQAAVHRMIKETDRTVGAVLDKLRELESAGNTLVFFVSDNGGIVSYGGRFTGQISSNGPLRGGKGQLFEGGIRVPAIAWQPGKISAGVVQKEPGMTFDLFPTVLELVGLEPPSAGSPHELDGISLVQIMYDGGGSLPDRLLFWEALGSHAVRDGQWKLLKMEENVPWSLYRLDQDPGETEDLAAIYPERAIELSIAWQHWKANVTGNSPGITP